MVSREQLIVFFNDKKCVGQIEKIVKVKYVSPKRKYLLFYCGSDESANLASQIKKINGVKSVEKSLRDLSHFSFEE